MPQSISKDSSTASNSDNLAIRSKEATISGRVMALARRIETERENILQSMQLLPGQDTFLLALMTTDGITMGTLAETLGIRASSATKAAIKLEASGLIRREASRIDSRQNYAYLTPAGREKVREIVAQYDKLDEKIFSKLKAKGSERLLNLLDRLQKADIGAGKQPRKAGAKKSGKDKTKKSKSKKKKNRKNKTSD